MYIHIHYLLYLWIISNWCMDSTVCISSEKYWTSKIRNWPSHPVLSKTNAQRLSAAGSAKTYVGALGQPWRYLGPVEAWVVNFAMGTVEPSPSKWPNFVAYNCGVIRSPLTIPGMILQSTCPPHEIERMDTLKKGDHFQKDITSTSNLWIVRGELTVIFFCGINFL